MAELSLSLGKCDYIGRIIPVQILLIYFLNLFVVNKEEAEFFIMTV
jgi:hypothetical protein